MTARRPREKARRFLRARDGEAPEVRILEAGVPHPGDFEQLVDSYQGLVFQYVYQLVRDYHLTQDLSQEIFLKVYRGLTSYDPAHLFSTWLLKVAHNHVVDHTRKRRLATISMDQTSSAGTPLGESLPQSRPEPAELVQQRHGTREIREAIYSLPLDHRSVLVLRYLEGRKLEEIAYILGLPLGTVKSRVNRARGTLQEKLVRKRRRREISHD